MKPFNLLLFVTFTMVLGGYALSYTPLYAWLDDNVALPLIGEPFKQFQEWAYGPK
jgi:hypothetical protein